MKNTTIKNIYLIHHSHTDIGYTERQDKIIRYHYDFIRQAIDILDEIHVNGKKEWEGFVWQCENYWQVENFYEMADETYREKFEYYVSTGEIGLSGNYLNMTELIGKRALYNALDKMQKYGEETGHPITAGMSADINGFAWGYVDALYDHGVRYFYSALHPHHGMFPLYKKVLPFYWEGPSGNRVLFWNGEHYHFGNELFLAPEAGNSYILRDEFHKRFQEHELMRTSAEDTAKIEWKILTLRLERYLDNLEAEGYKYNLVPLLVSGQITDNAPPSADVARRVQELNNYYEGKLHFEMVTLEQFFERVKESCKDIPIISGDWTDWWADGVGSTPSEVKMFREAARKYNICCKLDPENKFGDADLIGKSAKEQMLYAEHTWGYSSSVSEPWETLVSSLELKKGAYAVNANTHIAKNLDKILAANGEVSISHQKSHNYLVINPHDHAISTKAYLYIEFWEYLDGICYDYTIPIEVIDTQLGEVIPSQVKVIARATQIEIQVDLKAHERRYLKIRRKEITPYTILNHAHIGAEGVEDIRQSDRRVDEDEIETDDLILRFNDEKGLYSIIDKKDSTELLRDDVPDGAFAGVYEITDMKRSACEIRRQMGRNRKSKATRRYRSKLINRKIKEIGELYTAIDLAYSLKGTGMYNVYLKIYNHEPKIEAMVRVHKESHWEPENLYVALPFTAGKDTITYCDKTGCVIRPGIDQLPGSCQEFYLIQNAILWKEGKRNLAVITKDAPLITLGDLEAHSIVLCDGQDKEKNQSPVYSWPMNNYWETNFKVNLGGFYEFAYTFMLKDNMTPEEMFATCEEENEGLIACYVE